MFNPDFIDGVEGILMLCIPYQDNISVKHVDDACISSV